MATHNSPSMHRRRALVHATAVLLLWTLAVVAPLVGHAGQSDQPHTPPRHPFSAQLNACVALEKTGDDRGYRECLDQHVAALRASFTAAVSTDGSVPIPPRAMGVHTPCLKFGRSCPIEYAVFLESHAPPQAPHQPSLPNAPLAPTETVPSAQPAPPFPAASFPAEAASIPFAFNASWSYTSWSRLVDLYSHVEVLQRRLRTTTPNAKLRTADVLTPARVRDWQRRLQQQHQEEQQQQKQGGARSTPRSPPPGLWRCARHYTLPARVARALASLRLWLTAPPAETLPFLSGRVWVQRCITWLVDLVWPQWRWLWWLRRGVLVIQVWSLLDAFAGEPLDEAVVVDILNACPPSPSDAAPPGTTEAKTHSGGDGGGEDHTQPDAEPVPSTNGDVLAVAQGAQDDAPNVATSTHTQQKQEKEKELKAEQLVRYYSLVDLHLAQHVPIVFVKLRRVLCVCLLCEFLLLMVSFVEQWAAWAAPTPPQHDMDASATRVAPLFIRGLSPWGVLQSVSGSVLAWVSPWHAARRSLASSWFTSAVVVAAPVLVGIPTLVLAAKGLLEANRYLEEQRSRVLRDQAAVLRPSA